MNKLYPVSQLVAELIKMPVPPNKPIVGDNEFTFESGQVAYLIEKIRTTTDRPFQAFLPEMIGRRGYDYVLGKMSGGEIVTTRVAALGLEANKDQIKEILGRVKAEASMRKWSISDALFEDIARDVLGVAR